MGLEPTTAGTTTRSYHQLSYAHHEPAAATGGWVIIRCVATVLIVEDDDVLARVMRQHLSAAGYDVEWAADGDRALRKLRYEHPDVCVLDLMLPEVDGWSLIEQLRAEGDTTPIVAISARGSEHDKVHTLGIGADDYLVKPASMKELVARVGAAVRRAQIRPAASGGRAHRGRPA